MEYVSVLAGTTFSDHPRCTDPTLAALARFVNDASSDAGRPLLAAFAPVLTATHPGDARQTAAVVRAAARAAHAAAGDPAVLRRHVRRAERRYDRVIGDGPLAALARHLDPLYRRGAALRCLAVSVTALRALPRAQRDAALRAALAAAVVAARPAPATRAAHVAEPTRAGARP